MRFLHTVIADARRSAVSEHADTSARPSIPLNGKNSRINSPPFATGEDSMSDHREKFFPHGTVESAGVNTARSRQEPATSTAYSEKADHFSKQPLFTDTKEPQAAVKQETPEISHNNREQPVGIIPKTAAADEIQRSEHLEISQSSPNQLTRFEAPQENVQPPVKTVEMLPDKQDTEAENNTYPQQPSVKITAAEQESPIPVANMDQPSVSAHEVPAEHTPLTGSKHTDTHQNSSQLTRDINTVDMVAAGDPAVLENTNHEQPLQPETRQNTEGESAPELPKQAHSRQPENPAQKKAAQHRSIQETAVSNQNQADTPELKNASPPATPYIKAIMQQQSMEFPVRAQSYSLQQQKSIVHPPVYQSEMIGKPAATRIVPPAPAEPEIKIGQVDVFIEGPPTTGSAKVPSPRPTLGLASRHYLRRI